MDGVTGKSVAQAGRGPFIRASLCAGPCETTYLRVGSGRPLLLLARPSDPLARSLAAALATAHRVVTPELPPRMRPAGEPGASGVDFGRWLEDFLDGLGLVELALVVADERLCAPALGFAAGHPCRITRLVLLYEGPWGGQAEHEALQDRLGEAGQPLLVQRTSSSPRPERRASDIRVLAGTIGRFIAEQTTKARSTRTAP